MSFLTKCRKIIGIGRNFADHAKELGNAVPSKPMLFLKPPSSFVSSPGRIEIPQNSIVHHELELGVVIGTGGKNIAAINAMSHVAGYALALDMTARNIQNEAKSRGEPWTVAKGFDTFTPIGEFIEKDAVKDPQNLTLKLTVDEKLKQDGNTKDMIFNIPELIEYISKIMKLEPNDVILTGTPAGVGPVVSGNRLIGRLEQDSKILAEIKFDAINKQ